MSSNGSRRAAAKPRLSLLQRQQQLLEEQGFSVPSGTSKPVQRNKKQQRRRQERDQQTTRGRQHYGRTTSGPSSGFNARQEAHLTRQGRDNATSSSRQRAAMPEAGDVEGSLDDAVSSTTTASRVPSLHPSLAETTVSQACSEVTIGAGDATEYWDFQHRAVTAKDLGHTCRECRLPFTTIGEPLTERRGARISSRYHAECFSGYADPRSQAASSHHTGHHAGKQLDAAPARKATSKMRTGSHFEYGGAVRGNAASMGGKHGAIMSMGNNGFGAASSKGSLTVGAQPGPGGFTAAELQRHTSAIQEQERWSATGDEGQTRGIAKSAREERIARFLAEQCEVPTDASHGDTGQPSSSELEPEPDA